VTVFDGVERGPIQVGKECEGSFRALNSTCASPRVEPDPKPLKRKKGKGTEKVEERRGITRNLRGTPETL